MTKTYSHKKIYIKIRPKKKDISEDNIVADKPHLEKKNINKKIIIIKDDKTSLNSGSKKSNTFKKIKTDVNEIKFMNNLNKTYNSKTIFLKKNKKKRESKSKEKKEGKNNIIIKDNIEDKENKEYKEHKEHKEYRQSKFHKEDEEYRESKYYKENKKRKEYRDQKENKEHKHYKENKENKITKGYKEYKINSEKKEHKESKNKNENKGNKVKSKEIKNKLLDIKLNNSDFINRSFGDSLIEINKPKESQNFNFCNFIGRKSYMPFKPINCLFDKLSINNCHTEGNENKEKKKNKVMKHYDTDNNFNKIDDLLDDMQSQFNNNKHQFEIEEVKSINSFNMSNNNKNSDNELDKFFLKDKNKYSNIGDNELYRFSNVSLFHNNDLFYLNNKNKNNLFDDFSNKRNSYFINPKFEINEIEDHKILNDFLIDDSIFDNNIFLNSNKKNDILSIPCTNCEKMLNIDEIDEHSNNCFKSKEEIKNDYSNHNYDSILNIKLKNIYNYFSRIQNDKSFIVNNNIDEGEFFDLIQFLKKNIEEILKIKIFNSSSLNIMEKINNSLDKLMEKYFNSTNILTLISRIKIILEEKIKYFLENKNEKDEQKENSNNNNFRKTFNMINKKKNYFSYQENSIDEAISESETMELFDLKNMEKILNEKRELKTDNLVNEAKNKRLFLMEVLKVKYQKINNNKEEDLIQPIMIWEEAKKKKVKRNDWSKFIFEELNNPNKYLKRIQKRKERKKI